MDKEEWKRHLEAQVASGMSAPKYCEANGLSLNSFNYQRSSVQQASKKFVQVGGRELVEIMLPEGVELRVPASQIQVVIKALRG